MKKIGVSKLRTHFKQLSAEEAVYCIDSQTKEQKKCCEKLIEALKHTPTIPMKPENVPPLI